jgi:hypothetical protein
MIRNTCVICRNSSLEDIFTMQNYPITPSSNHEDVSTDEYADCIFASCNVCGSVQLKTLVDPIKLYKDSHNSTEDTPTWKEHHLLFAEFICKHSNTSRVLEIGGNSGTLYKHLCSSLPNYTILDICDSERRPKNVPFVQGNCESYDLSGHTDIIMSHTFEHLYNPLKFIENLSRGRVQSVYISIPNMEHLYASKNISVLHNEHTFFVGEQEIKYMFSLNGYVCNTVVPFKNHSTFYKFVLDSSSSPLTIPTNTDRSLAISSYMAAFEHSLKDIVVDRACFICPAGHYGQKIYYYLQKYNEYMLGFIDNDPSKQGKRVYGTPLKVFRPDVLNMHTNKSICVVLFAGPYREELKAQLNMIHNNIRYIDL